MATRKNPLDTFVSDRPMKFEVKVPNMPKLGEAVRNNGFQRGVESQDENLEQWRADLERQMRTAISNAVADAIARIAAIPAAPAATTQTIVVNHAAPAAVVAPPATSVAGLPAGGTDGQVLEKTSDANYEVAWVTIPPTTYASVAKYGGF